MTDVHSAEIRSKNMKAIRSKDTGPELLLRKALHASGLGYSLHSRNLAGAPDLAFRRYRSIVFVHGCFWHGHENCRYFKWPESRIDFWRRKITGNMQNDKVAIESLVRDSWRVAVVWECAIRRKRRFRRSSY